LVLKETGWREEEVRHMAAMASLSAVAVAISGLLTPLVLLSLTDFKWDLTIFIHQL
jgi:hypothetical protein